MDKDNVLRKVFLVSEPKKAMKVLLEGELYMASKTGIYKGPATSAEQHMTPGKPYQIQDIEVPSLADINRLKPEVMLDSMQVPLAEGAENLTLITVPTEIAGQPAGVWALNKWQQQPGYGHRQSMPVTAGKDSFVELGIMLFWVPDFISATIKEHGYSMQDFKPVIMRTKVSAVAVIVLTGDCGMLCVPLCCVEMQPPYTLEITLPDGSIVDGDGYKPDSKKYKSLKVRRKKMLKGLTTPLKEKKENKEIKEAVETPVTGVIKPVEVASSLATEIPADTLEDDGIIQPVAPKEEATEEVEAVEETADQSAEAVVEEVKPKRRQRQNKPVGIDLSSTIELISSPVDDLQPDKVEAAIKEAEQLRDNIIASARRLKNILDALNKMSKEAVKTYQALQTIMKQ